MSAAKFTKEQRGATLCWHCLKHLVWAKGGTVKFSLVVDAGGTQHRVHMDCVRRVIGDGVREVKPAKAV